MDFPVEILNDVTAIIEHGSQWVAAQIPGDLASIGLRQVLYMTLAKRLPFLRSLGPAETKLRFERLEETVSGLQDELHKQRSEHPDHSIDVELLEPATTTFFVHAFEAAMESPDANKRDLLGRLIARRMFMKTESSDELYLRHAESITERLNRQHLYAIATVYLVRYAPLPSGHTRDTMYKWMDEHLLPALQTVAAADPTYDDLDYLTSLGAVLYDGSDHSNNLLIGETTPAIESRVLQATLGHFEPFSNKPVGHFYETTYELFEGKFSKENGQERISLAPYTLTIPGLTIGAAVVDRILGQSSQ